MGNQEYTVLQTTDNAQHNSQHSVLDNSHIIMGRENFLTDGPVTTGTDQLFHILKTSDNISVVNNWHIPGSHYMHS